MDTNVVFKIKCQLGNDLFNTFLKHIVGWVTDLSKEDQNAN